MLKRQGSDINNIKKTLLLLIRRLPFRVAGMDSTILAKFKRALCTRRKLTLKDSPLSAFSNGLVLGHYFS
jgi:hypothetical protein